MSLSNNKFQLKCIELEKQLDTVTKMNSEKEMRINLMKTTLSNIQTDVKRIKSLEAEITNYKTANDTLTRELNSKNAEIVKLSREVFERKRDLAEPKVPIVIENEKDPFEQMYTNLSKTHKNVLEMYEMNSKKIQDLEERLDLSNRHERELIQSIENIKNAAHKYKTQAIKLKTKMTTSLEELSNDAPVEVVSTPIPAKHRRIRRR